MYLSVQVPPVVSGIPVARCIEEYLKEETLASTDGWYECIFGVFFGGVDGVLCFFGAF